MKLDYVKFDYWKPNQLHESQLTRNSIGLYFQIRWDTVGMKPANWIIWMKEIALLTRIERDEEIEEAPGQDDDVVDVEPGSVDNGCVTHT